MRSSGKRVAGIGSTLRYNERKVGKGMAERIYAGNFLKEARDLTSDKIREHFDRFMESNQRVVKNANHIILSFSPKEVVDNVKMARVAREFMDRIDFGRQPYVV